MREFVSEKNSRRLLRYRSYLTLRSRFTEGNEAGLLPTIVSVKGQRMLYPKNHWKETASNSVTVFWS